MADFWTTVGSGDFARIIALSLGVSLSATGLAILFGLPLGASLAVFRFPGRRSLIVIVNALLGLPPVVVGLALYLVLSRAGPLGELRMLFTPGAMVLAQTVLATPIVAALVHRAVADLWLDYGGALRIRRSDAAARHTDAARHGTQAFAHGGPCRLRPHHFRGRRHPGGRRQYRGLYPHHDDDDCAGDQQGQPGARPRAGTSS